MYVIISFTLKTKFEERVIQLLKAVYSFALCSLRLLETLAEPADVNILIP